MDQHTAARYERFLNSPVAKAHMKIREEIVSELHLDFERRESGMNGMHGGMHAVCSMCRGSIAQLTQEEPSTLDENSVRVDHETGYTYTLETLATLFMAHFMQRHYEQEGRRG